MFGCRTSFRGRLRVETDLHVGGADSKADREHEFAPVMCGANGPIIPASSLKGVLRAALIAAGRENDAKRLFGEILDHDKDKGRIAELWLDHARMAKAAAGDLSGLAARRACEGRFRAMHVALDADSGAAAPNQLFDREMIAAGAEFMFAGDFFADDPAELAPIFAALEQGVHVGKAASKGCGLIRLVDRDVVFRRHGIGKDGRASEKAAAQDRIDAMWRRADELKEAFSRTPARRVTLRLACEGPFISVRDIARDEGAPEGATEKVQPLMRDGRPHLWPESIAGALRARARWLLEVARARGEFETGRPAEATLDDRRLEQALEGRGTVRSREDVASLTPCERLFGVTGWRSRLKVESVTCVCPGEAVEIASVSIDRITGAGREGFLFTEKTRFGVAFKVVLSLDARAGAAEAGLFDALLADIETNGIELGHGAAKGFGWFDAKVVEERGART